MFGKKTGSDVPLSSETPAAPVPAISPADVTDKKDVQLPAVTPGAQGDVTFRDRFGLQQQANAADPRDLATAGAALAQYTDPHQETPDYVKAKAAVIEELVSTINLASLQKLSIEKRRGRVEDAAETAINALELPLTRTQISMLKEQAIDEILGLGPLEPLLADPDVADILINTANKVYIEKFGKVYLTDVKFLSERHLMGVIQRIVSRVGRRVDEASPMVDARLADGSRFNAIVPPLALDGALVSIRKFKKNKMKLRDYLQHDSMTLNMAQFLELCAFMRLNIIISGGTGSGKTTLLNALSGNIEATERVITIEDAAELQLAQPHVLRLETRPASTEGTGEITQRQLVKNALRMRPDRIILGEIRGDEVIDVLAAMNTGHDGSMATIHANNPRDCLARIENLVSMSGVSVPHASLRYQISSAVQMIIQIARMRDGKRRITHIEEIVGAEGDIITTQTLFSYKARGVRQDGTLEGEFIYHGIRPRFAPRAEYYGVEKQLMECLAMPAKP